MVLCVSGRIKTTSGERRLGGSGPSNPREEGARAGIGQTVPLDGAETILRSRDDIDHTDPRQVVLLSGKRAMIPRTNQPTRERIADYRAACQDHIGRESSDGRLGWPTVVLMVNQGRPSQNSECGFSPRRLEANLKLKYVVSDS
ncbi:hypothetical protein THAOC_26829 [Thalassiosira oceanica]|uniref:Uncharacterized protein n=1 Tax=Thalassiosira oceanica TaxID=159749 RepID=K0RKI2_THAOC|nr:hypothetical protein THAOC_26829 [Thalassiosira oceanica]|eukprot:EJK53680.1 hypothetical protein THAOC_26829 [Thalassiosira oceanica]